LAELNHAQGSGSIKSENPELREAAEQKAVLASKYYMQSAEQNDIVGLHWIGVFFHEGFGVAKNIPKAIEFLERAAAKGNGQSIY